MDPVTTHRLREQELSLRAVKAIFLGAEERMARLGGNVGWVGPASDAYGLGVYTLGAEMLVAGDHLAAALAGTTNALNVSQGYD